MKISIIVPIYNTNEFLPKCIESIINQTYTNLEIILVDDGSTDGSDKIVDDYAEKDTRIIAIHKENGGVSSARNTGMQASTGDYIGFIDADDYIEPCMYEEFAKCIENDNPDMVICGICKDEAGDIIVLKNELNVSKEVFDRDELLRYVFYRDTYRSVGAYCWNKVFRRELVLGDKPVLWDQRYKIAEDVFWFSNVVLDVNSVKYIDKSLYYYVQRDSSAFHSRDIDKRYDLILVYQELILLFGQYNIPDDVIKYVKRFLAYHAMCVAKLAYEEKDDDILKKCIIVMKKYKNEYIETNAQYGDRIEEYCRVIELVKY